MLQRSISQSLFRIYGGYGITSYQCLTQIGPYECYVGTMGLSLRIFSIPYLDSCL
jgi:hypothetical protein